MLQRFSGTGWNIELTKGAPLASALMDTPPVDMPPTNTPPVRLQLQVPELRYLLAAQRWELHDTDKPCLYCSGRVQHCGE